jgi:hypothetical protein
VGVRDHRRNFRNPFCSEPNMTERSEIHLIEAGDDAAFVARARRALDETKTVDPEDLHCMMLCAITKDGKVKIDVIGTDMDIAKMLMIVTTVTRNSIEQAESSVNHTKEVLQ